MILRYTTILLGLNSLVFAQVGVTSSAGSSFQGQRAPVGVPVPGNQPGAQPEKEQTPASIEGQVVNGITGEPIKRVNLMLMGAPPRPEASSYSATTDASGNFTMSNIPPGTYQLSAEKTGYVRGNYGARGAMRPGSSLTLSAGQTLKQVSFRLQPHAVISGRILDEEGEPLANVQVQAMLFRYMQGKRQLMPANGGSTNDLGEYRIFGLAPGRYYLSATYRGGQMMMQNVVPAGPGANQPEEGYAATYYPGSTDPTAAVQIPVVAGRPADHLDMKLSRVRTVRVRGRVTNTISAMPGRTMVMLIPQNSNGFTFFDRSMTSPQGRDGKFEIRGVTPGAYYVSAQYYEDNTRYIGRVAVTVGNSNVEDVEVAIKPGVEITGNVRLEGDTNNTDLSATSIFLQPKDFSPMSGGGSGRVKQDGTFVIRSIAPDTYRLQTFGGSQTFYVKSMRAGQQDVSNGEIAIIDGAPPVLNIVLSAAGGQVNGQVTAEKQGAAQGAMVVLIPSTDKRDQQQLYKTASADQYGKFSLKAIPPGDYTLLAWDNVEPGAWQDPEFLAPFETQGKKISVKENDVLSADLPLLKNDDAQNPTGGQ